MVATGWMSGDGIGIGDLTAPSLCPQTRPAYLLVRRYRDELLARKREYHRLYSLQLLEAPEAAAAEVPH